MATDTLPRYERTPEAEADDAAQHLFHLYMARHPGSSVDDWYAYAERVRGYSSIESRGDLIVRRIREKGIPWSIDSGEMCDALAEAGLGYCIDVFNTTPNERQVAWTYVADAVERTVAALCIYMAIAKARSKASKAANARHKENRWLKQDAIDWYLANRGAGTAKMTKDAAAEKIAGNIVPAKFRTVRDWLSQVRD